MPSPPNRRPLITPSCGWLTGPTSFSPPTSAGRASRRARRLPTKSQPASRRSSPGSHRTWWHLPDHSDDKEKPEGTATMTSDDPRLMANAIRFLSMDAIERAGEGHPGTPLGAADVTTALFTRHLKFNAADPLW